MFGMYVSITAYSVLRVHGISLILLRSRRYLQYRVYWNSREPFKERRGLIKCLVRLIRGDILSSLRRPRYGTVVLSTAAVKEFLGEKIFYLFRNWTGIERVHFGRMGLVRARTRNGSPVMLKQKKNIYRRRGGQISWKTESYFRGLACSHAQLLDNSQHRRGEKKMNLKIMPTVNSKK